MFNTRRQFQPTLQKTVNYLDLKAEENERFFFDRLREYTFNDIFM